MFFFLLIVDFFSRFLLLVENVNELTKKKQKKTYMFGITGTELEIALSIRL